MYFLSLIKHLAAKALESKHPKFMRTIEETGPTPIPTSGYNTMLSSTLGK